MVKIHRIKLDNCSRVTRVITRELLSSFVQSIIAIY